MHAPQRLRFLLHCVLGFVMVLAASAAFANDTSGPETAEQTQQALQAFDLSPAIFVENKGQWDESVRFGFDGKGVKVSFTDAGPVFQMLKSTGDKESRETQQTVFSAAFAGARQVRPTALEPSSVKMNYYIGNDPSRWRSDVPAYHKMLYKGLYEGVDLYTWGKRSGLKYEFHVAPGADWRQIVVRYDGIEGLSIDDKGALHVKTSLGEMVDEAPVVYQEKDGRRVEIAARFCLADERSYGFDVTGVVDPSLPLVLDPYLAWGSYLGGSGLEIGYGIARDGAGNTWVTGQTNSANFPVLGGFSMASNGDFDAFVVRIAPGGALAWASYLGGSGYDRAFSIACDGAGNAWVIGDTGSANFPVPGGFSLTHNGSADAFVARITSGGALAWASYLGGNSSDCGRAIACDGSGNAWVTGYTNSTNFPVLGAFSPANSGSEDAFVARITPAGTLGWASYLGGSGVDEANAIACDNAGNAWVTGFTGSTNFPVLGAFSPANSGGGDVFVTRITPGGTLAWSSYLGGTAAEWAYGIACDGAGNAWVTGYTQSTNFPVLGAFSPANNGGNDAFVTRITPGGALGWSSYLGGSGVDEANAIACDNAGNAWVTGITNSTNFPVAGGFDLSPNGDVDVFVAKVAPGGALVWGSYLGGSAIDQAYGIVCDGAGNATVTGRTYSTNFPVLGGFSVTNNGGSDVFVSAITVPRVTTAALAAGFVGSAYSQTLAAADGTPAYTWGLASGSLPAGLSLSGTGVISGTPTAAGTSSFTVQVYDSLSSSDRATKALTITVNPALAVTTASLPDGQIGVAYNHAVAATGGLAPYAWCISAGSLPAGLSINGFTGAISGTPTASGASNFTVQVTDAQSPADTATRALSISIPADLSIPTASLPNGQIGVAYSQTVIATGGVAAYAWSVSAGSLPAGLSVNGSTGVISGTPTASGASSFTVQVTDAQSPADSATSALSITIPEDLSVTTTTLPSGQVAAAYSQTVTAAGGVAPYVWSISSGSLPAGLTLDASTGVISATPTAWGISSFTIEVVDSQSPADTATMAISITVEPEPLAVTTAALPGGQVGASYSQALCATGGVAPYSWSIESGSLPAGLSLDGSTGVISGTPTAAGTTDFTVSVSDSQTPPATATKALSITIVADLFVVTASLQGAAPGTAYSQTLIAQGGVTPYAWSLASGSLPPGLSLDGPTGVISGTPTTNGIYNFTVCVADSQSPADTADKALHIIISDGPTYHFIASDAEQFTTNTNYIAKTVLTFTPPTADDWLIFGFCEWRCPNLAYATYVQMFIDGVGEGQNTRKPVDGTDYMPFITVKGTQLSAAPHTIKLMYRAGSASAAAYVRNARICAVRKAALEYYNAARDTAAPLTINSTDIVTLSWTPVAAGNYIVISTAELNATTAVSTKLQTVYNGTVNDEGVMRAADNGDYTTFMSFNYIVAPALVPISHKIVAWKISADSVNHYVRRARILALRLSNGRLNNTAAGYGTEQTTAQTSFQQAISTSWTYGVSGNWLFLNSARMLNTSTNCQTELRVQLNDMATSGQQLMKPKHSSDLLNYSSIDIRNLAASPRRVDMDFRTTNAAGTAKIRRLRFYGLPLDQP